MQEEHRGVQVQAHPREEGMAGTAQLEQAESCGTCEDELWMQAHSHQGPQCNLLLLVACVTSVARARRRLAGGFLQSYSCQALR